MHLWIVVCFALGGGCAVTSVERAGPITTAPDRIYQDLAKRQEDDEAVCGFLDGEPVSCMGGHCGFLSVRRSGDVYAGCCDSSQCYFYTTCLENRSADGDMTLGCVGSSSACAINYWVDEGATGYSCAESSTINLITHISETSFPMPSSSEPTGGGEPSTGTVSPTQTEAFPTQSGSPTLSASPTKTAGDDGSPPGLGSEHGTFSHRFPAQPDVNQNTDLNTQQRIGAGVGSGVLGSLFLGVFLIFGCLLPLRRS
ncbi:hypothetical protein B0I35DRAFT_434694 [Stachybotrys elegans]|uniref:Uncharacterized protein n=1 Tax=Stachybotrys elegans TaxID=80388 RepID=A0A8K0SQT8_9HYPO|nr:hypothetical protein B0I35DRAFT_434694 [Stachybotrys elegans]